MPELPLTASAPEYALDEQLVTASDMYSLGCLIYAVHCKGKLPFKNHGSLGSLRENAGKTPAGLDRLDADLQGTPCPLDVNVWIDIIQPCCAHLLHDTPVTDLHPPRFLLILSFHHYLFQPSTSWIGLISQQRRGKRKYPL